MIKILAFTLTLAVFFALCAPALSEKDAERDRWLYEKSLECAVMLGKLARSDGYIRSMLNEPAGSMKDILEEMRLQDYSRPTSMRIYGFRDILISLAIISELGIGTDEDVRNFALRRTYAAASTLLTEKAGYETLVLTSALTYSTACRSPETLNESVMVILAYEGNWSVAMLFTAYPEQVAVVGAVLVPAFDGPLTNPFITTPEIYREDALKALIAPEPI